ncbi:hypothetical protein AVEN_275735-1 [Araneus ventricosus]|uniref:Uncharacterized protein n=1 Tax=Araneus ventricosus TaxID=182803 RepID=A0A4Y2LS45_ARAVE|nr:hypothetical protein AVEN_275735-1 [Araneus ventricosus]
MKHDSVFFVTTGEPPLFVRKDSRGISKKYPAENVSTEPLEGARAEVPSLWYAYPWGTRRTTVLPPGEKPWTGLQQVDESKKEIKRV